MAEWQTVAKGTNIWDLRETVADLELPKGSRLRMIMDLHFPIGFIFDVAGAELAFKPFVPDGMTLIDVYGEGSQGVVDMEADPAWLIAVLAFIKAHWVIITIAGLALTTIVAFITVMIKVPAAAVAAFPIGLVVGGALAIIGLTILGARSMSRSPP